MTSWRDRAAPVITEVIARVGRSDMQLLRKELRAAYPFGERKYFPYKVWCDEIRRQLGLKRVPTKLDSRGSLVPVKELRDQGQLF